MNKYTGSDFDDFLEQEGIREEVTARALKRLLAMQVTEAMNGSRITKQQLADRLHTSRSQVGRLLDPENTAVTLETLDRLANAIGRQLRIDLAQR